MFTYAQITEARKALGPIPSGIHKKHDGVYPYTGNVIGAAGYYSACVRGHKARPDVPQEFWKPEYFKDGYLTQYDLNLLPRYVPQGIKRVVQNIMETRNDTETLSLVIVRHYNGRESAVVLGVFLIDSHDQKIVWETACNYREKTLEVLSEYRKRLVPLLAA